MAQGDDFFRSRDGGGADGDDGSGGEEIMSVTPLSQARPCLDDAREIVKFREHSETSPLTAAAAEVIPGW